MPPQTPTAPQTTGGPINRVPCPHCGHHNDCRLLNEQNLLEAGHKIDCDRCHRFILVLSVQPIVWVQVRQLPGVAPGHNPPAGTQLQKRR